MAPKDVIQKTDVGACYASVVLGNPVVSDNCGIKSVTNDAPSHFKPGETIVNWTVEDKNGNTSTASQLVSVTNDVPVIINFTATIAPVALTQSVTATGTFTDNNIVSAELDWDNGILTNATIFRSTFQALTFTALLVYILLL